VVTGPHSDWFWLKSGQEMIIESLDMHFVCLSGEQEGLILPNLTITLGVNML